MAAITEIALTHTCNRVEDDAGRQRIAMAQAAKQIAATAICCIHSEELTCALRISRMLPMRAGMGARRGIKVVGLTFLARRPCGRDVVGTPFERSVSVRRSHSPASLTAFRQ